MTPIHWKKEEARVIKLSEFEKHEADRKIKEEKNKERQHSRERGGDEGASEKGSQHGGDSKKEVDYNALDYEDANQSEEEQEPKKVSSLVQYPISVTTNGAQKQEGTESDLVPNKRSDALALALGVQVKTGEDPPDGDIQISGYKKPPQTDFKMEEIRETHVVNSKLLKPEVVEQEQNKTSERNKFNVEKPANAPYQHFSSGRRVDRDRRDRFYRPARFYRRPPR